MLCGFQMGTLCNVEREGDVREGDGEEGRAGANEKFCWQESKRRAF